MIQKKYCKIIGILSVIALLLASLYTGVFAAADASFDLQAAVSAAEMELSNETTAEQFKAQLAGLLPSGYSVASVDEYYLLKAIEGAVDVTDPQEPEVLVPGDPGYIAAAVTVNTAEQTVITQVVTKSFEIPKAEYTFASVSKPEEFTLSSDGKTLTEYTPPASGTPEKIVIPEGVETIDVSDDGKWLPWAGTTDNRSRSFIRCIVYPESLKGTVPDQGSCAALEVVSFKGDGVTALAAKAFYGAVKLKHINLPENLVSIGDSAMSQLSVLKTVRLPVGLKTIGTFAFGEWSAQNKCGLEEITIPASVTSIGENAFAYPLAATGKTVTITVLNNKIPFGTDAFRASAANAPIVLRVADDTADDSDIYSACLNKWPNTNVYDLNGMTLTEAAARAARRADELRDGYFSSNAAVLAELTAAYGNIQSITAAWKHNGTENDGTVENTLILSKNGLSAEISVVMNALPTYDLQSSVDASDITVSNATTEAEFEAALKGLSLPDGYTVTTVTEFYKLNAIDGAVDNTNAENPEILVEGHVGAIAATVNVTDTAGQQYIAAVTRQIEPQMEGFVFASVSDEDDFVWNGESWAQRWEYQPGQDENGNYITHEKIVVPDKVTELKADWLQQWNHPGIRCIVYPEGLTGAIPDQGSVTSLEVVSFKGNKVTELGTKAFYNATSLKYIDLPEGIVTIGTRALGVTSSLKTLRLPESLQTIGEMAFSEWNPKNIIGLEEITVPASVTSIGSYAFAYPIQSESKTMTVTMLNNRCTIGTETFNALAGSTPIVLRVADDPGRTDDAYSVSGAFTNTTVYDLNNMSLTEAAARATAKAAEVNGCDYTDPDNILGQLINAYGGLGGVFAAFDSENWEDSGESLTNSVILSKNGVSFKLAVSMLKPLELTELDVELDVDNQTTAESLKSAINNALADGRSVVSVDEFYKQNAVSGAVDVSTAYPVAPEDKVLVPGVKGYVSAVVTVAGADTEKYLVYAEIEPKMEEYTFDSVSDDSEFTLGDNGKSLIFYNGSADKIVIPESVEVIKGNNGDSNWLPFASDSECRHNIKCIVYPEGLTGTIPDQAYMSSLEVVSFKGDGVTEFGKQAFAYASNLKHINLPKGLKTIGNRALSQLSSLETVVLPDGLQSIGELAFGGWNGENWGLREITIPASVTAIGNYAFLCPYKEDGKTLTVTLLTNRCTVGTEAFKSSTANAPLVLRVADDPNRTDDAYNSVNAAWNTTVENLEDMSFAEAFGRTRSAALELADEEFSDSAIVKKYISDRYANIAGIAADWTGDWQDEDGNRVNSLHITKNGYSASVKVSLVGKTSFYADGASILTTDAFLANGQKQGLRFYNSFESSAADKIFVKGKEYTVSEFGVLLKYVGNDSISIGVNQISDEAFVIGAEGVMQQAGKPDAVQSSGGKNFYTVYIKNIPQGGKEYSFQCRGYIKYLGEDGETQVIYTDSQIKSVQSVYILNSTAPEYSGMSDWFAGE